MTIEFYDVKNRQMVSIPKTHVYKRVITVRGQNKYVLRGKTTDGRTLTRFVSKKTWDETDVR